MKCRKPSFLFLLILFSAFINFSRAQSGFVENSIIFSTDDSYTVSDTSHLFIIREILIEGNKRTKENIILRELPFHQNQQYTLKDLVEKFALAKQQLLNIGLFREVVVALKNFQGQDASVLVSVKERWYIYPVPFVSVVDVSLQEWVKEQNMNLRRVNYGIQLTHNNTTGRNDKLYVNLTNGYTKQVAVQYKGLYLDKRLHWSSNLNIGFGKNSEINYATISNRQVYYKDTNQFVHSFFRAGIEFVYRPAIKTRHIFGISYHSENFQDTIFRLNPSFSFQPNKIQYPKFFYTLEFFDVDFIPYPTKGFAAEASLEKRGVDKSMNLWQLSVRTNATWPLSNNYFFNLGLTGIMKLPLRQPYITQHFIGQDNMYLQGYEDYTINGVAGGYTKATFSKQFLNTAIHIPSERIKRLNHIPLKIFGKVYGNTGYIYNQHVAKNSLSKKWLYSGGVGLDIILFYDLVFKIEWSLNHLGQNGLYLHNRRYL
ncbi:MAG: POTRA domain-containing protein [Chitinophagaceae bacterium]